MTTNPLPQSARRSIVALANRQYELISDFCFQIAMDTIAESDIVITGADFDDEERMEEITRDYAMLIQNQVIARIHLTHMLATTGE